MITGAASVTVTNRSESRPSPGEPLEGGRA